MPLSRYFGTGRRTTSRASPETGLERMRGPREGGFGETVVRDLFRPAFFRDFPAGTPGSKKGISMQRKTVAALVAGLFVTSAQAEISQTLDAILVTATRIPMPDVTAPYASEVHTRTMIEASGAVSLFDYLSRHTSVHVQPSFGNRFTPKLDMRGYGIGDGYQNIVITLNGRRLNNIDMVPQLIGAIPLADIERLEITKGSGSVMFGDGATAGSIQIHTRAHDGVSMAVSVGNAGERTGSLTAGMHRERISLHVGAEYQADDGHSAVDPSGHRDESSLRSWQGGIEARPLTGIKLGLEGGSARIDTRYVNDLTLAEFRDDPAQLGSNPYTSPLNSYNRQRLNTDFWRAHGALDLPHGWKVEGSHAREDKLSDYNPFWRPDYDHEANDLALRYEDDALSVIAGVQRFHGSRHDGADRAGKRNTGWYLHGQYRQGKTTVSAGARREDIDYTYQPAAGASSRAGHGLSAWDLGVNHRLDGRLSLFANYNRAFQAPDIDRFFTFGGGFNGFISPAISRTLTVGLNHVTAANRLKLSLFRANLDNEIYYLDTGNFLTSYNTNLDKTHKYGLELQDTWRAGEALTLGLHYAYTRAVIDRESDGGGAFNGKDLPGVPRHHATLSANYRLNHALSMHVTHAWRDSAWAATDFDNNNAQKQATFQSTDLALRYQRGELEWFAAVDNLFKRKHGVWVADDVIYPYGFTRNWRVGLKATF